jgi:SAM-dependent methyltransferase
MGSARTQGRLWGGATRDWAEVCEPFTRPLYDAAFAALAPLVGLTLLDAGCGAGLAMRVAAGQGAHVCGVDAAAPMLALTRERLPDADLRVGDIQHLPFEDGTFDVVTAFNAVQYAADPAAAVSELARVTRRGGRVTIGLWAEPARCDTDALFQRIRALAPPPPGTPAPLALSTPGVIEDLLTATGLTTVAAGEVPCPFEYPDLATAWRGQASIGPFRLATETAGEEAVRQAFTEELEPFRQSDATYRQHNVFRYVIAHTPTAEPN